LKNKVISKEDIEKIRKNIEKEVIEAHLVAINSPYPKKEEVMKYVFKD
jgi:TPP-dependent pyruvate/acetoin dehydrogenase alpha subunit